MTKIAIIDYQMGNLRSVQKGFEKVGHQATITSDPRELAPAERSCCRGWGRLADAMAELRRRDLVRADSRRDRRAGKPFLGICLGMQLLFDVGWEGGESEGLGMLPGKVVRFEFPPAIRSRTWVGTACAIKHPAPTPEGIAHGTILHSCIRIMPLSYYKSVVAIEADYGHPSGAAGWRDNPSASQFHPEKSQAEGLKILKNFAEL